MSGLSHNLKRRQISLDLSPRSRSGSSFSGMSSNATKVIALACLVLCLIFSMTSRTEKPQVESPIKPPKKLKPKNVFENLPLQKANTIRAVIISDTHGRHGELVLPRGDVLFHLGDVATRGSLDDIRSFAKWIADQPFEHKIVINGNHDKTFPVDTISLEDEYKDVATFARDSLVEIKGLRILCLSWRTCNQEFFEKILRKYHKKDAIDMLLTHRPPTIKGFEGSKKLDGVIKALDIPLHLFGHYHSGRGVVSVNDDRLLINCATLEGMKPVVIDISKETRRATMVYLLRPGNKSLLAFDKTIAYTGRDFYTDY
jgi:Icc-related predicted phosphoesterase